MTRKILTLLADDLAEPFLDLWVVHVVVVHPTFIARVLWRIDVDTLDPALVLRQKRLQRGEVVAVNDHVLIVGM